MPSPDPAQGSSAPSTVDAAEAIQAVLRAAIDVGRQILDAVERAVEDPATAQKLGDVVAGLTALAGLADRGAPDADTSDGPGRGRPGGIEHIEVS